MRFNLRIQHVHRGLLLGTGPLVDPGFQGNLLIPVHNLTAEPYVLRADEGFIWMEFTRTSYVPTGEAHGVPRSREDVWANWERRKNSYRPEIYFDKANKNRPIRSSIPVAAAEALSRALRAERAAKRAATLNAIFFGLGTLAIAGTVAGLFSLFEAVKGNVNSAVTLASTVSSQANAADAEAKSASADVKSLKERLDRLGAGSDPVQLRHDVDVLRRRVDELSAERDRTR